MTDAFVNGLLISWWPPNISLGLSSFFANSESYVVRGKLPWEAGGYLVECFQRTGCYNRLVEIVYPLPGYSLPGHRRLWHRICTGKESSLQNGIADIRIALFPRLERLRRYS